MLTGTITAFVGMVVGAALALAGDSNLKEWPCPGTPRQPCWSPFGDHSWGHVQAVNLSNGYRKCAVLVRFDDLQNRVCASGTVVLEWADDYPIRCGRPNNATKDTNFGCAALLIKVGNDTDVHHGLRGTGAY